MPRGGRFRIKPLVAVTAPPCRQNWSKASCSGNTRRALCRRHAGRRYGRSTCPRATRLFFRRDRQPAHRPRRPNALLWSSEPHRHAALGAHAARSRSTRAHRRRLEGAIWRPQRRAGAVTCPESALNRLKKAPCAARPVAERRAEFPETVPGAGLSHPPPRVAAGRCPRCPAAVMSLLADARLARQCAQSVRNAGRTRRWASITGLWMRPSPPRAVWRPRWRTMRRHWNRPQPRGPMEAAPSDLPGARFGRRQGALSRRCRSRAARGAVLATTGVTAAAAGLNRPAAARSVEW